MLRSKLNYLFYYAGICAGEFGLNLGKTPSVSEAILKGSVEINFITENFETCTTLGRLNFHYLTKVLNMNI